jgi:hypothetical protein
VRSEEELNDMMEQVPFNDWFSNLNPISLHDLESCKYRHKRPKPLVLIENVFPKASRVVNVSQIFSES